MDHGVIRGRTTGRAMAIKLAMLAVVGAAAPALAVPEPAASPATSPAIAPADTSAAALIADLASPKFAVREAASRALAGGAAKLSEIEAALERPDLAPEQRVRLLAAGRAVFSGSDRGALGVQFDTTALDGTVIGQVLPGFPANLSLKARDRIKRISGVRVDTPDPMGRQRGVRPLVVARDPGDEVLMLIEREGQEVEVSVRLGRFRDLNNAALPSSYDLDEAWSVRRSIDAKGRPVPGGALQGVVAVKIAADTRAMLNVYDDSSSDSAFTGAPADAPERFGLIAGGQPQGAAAPRTGAPDMLGPDPEQVFLNGGQGFVNLRGPGGGGQVVIRGGGGGQVVIRGGMVVGGAGQNVQQMVFRNGQLVGVEPTDRGRSAFLPGAVVDAQCARLTRDISSLMQLIEAIKLTDRGDRPQADRDLFEARLKRAQTDLIDLERRLQVARSLAETMSRIGGGG